METLTVLIGWHCGTERAPGRSEAFAQQQPMVLLTVVEGAALSGKRSVWKRESSETA